VSLCRGNKSMDCKNRLGSRHQAGVGLFALQGFESLHATGPFDRRTRMSILARPPSSWRRASPMISRSRMLIGNSTYLGSWLTIVACQAIPTATRTISLPKFRPSSMPIKASGVFPRPSTMSSR
jgi:hypothetical protein